MNVNMKATLALIAACIASLSMTAFAQPAKAKVDARAMAPGLQSASEPVAAPPAASGLTRNQRQEAALQARQEGNLAPAGEAADPRGERRPTPPVRAAVAQAAPPAAPTPAVVPPPAPPTVVAVATPPVPPVSTKKKARKPVDLSTVQQRAAAMPSAKPARVARPGPAASAA